MPSPLTADQLTSLAQLFSQFADTELNANDKLPIPNQTADAQIRALTKLSDNLANAAAATAFNDAATAYQQLSNVTTQANERATRLKADVAKFDRIVAIATDVVALGTSLGSGNAMNVFAAVNKLQTTLSNN